MTSVSVYVRILSSWAMTYGVLARNISNTIIKQIMVTLNLQDLTLQDWNWTDRLTGVEIAGLESDGPIVRRNLSVYTSVYIKHSYKTYKHELF